MAVKKITETGAVEEIKSDAYLLATQQETEEGGTKKETLVRAKIANVIKALLRDGVEITTRVEKSDGKQEFIIRQGEKEVARIAVPGKSSGNSWLFSDDSTVEGDHNAVFGEENTVKARNAIVGGIGNTVSQCSDGAIIVGNGLNINRKDILAAFGTAQNHFILFSDGTIECPSIPNLRVLNSQSRFDTDMFTENTIYVYARIIQAGMEDAPVVRYIPLQSAVTGDPGVGGTIEFSGYDYEDDVKIKGTCSYVTGDAPSPVEWTIEQVSKLDATSAPRKVYVTGTTGEQDTIAWGYDASCLKIPRRDIYGNLTVPTQSIDNPPSRGVSASVGYVHDLVDEKTKTIYINGAGYGVNIKDGTTYELNTVFDDVYAHINEYRFMYVDSGNTLASVPISARIFGNSSIDLGCILGWTAGIMRYKYASWGRTSHLVTWYNNEFYGDDPCLIEGTLVQMADGTDKPIEDVRPGDIVKSYNPATSEMADAVVIDAYITGYSRKFDVYNFTGGQSLTVYGMHGIYRPAKGTTQDIREWKLGARAMDLSGESATLIGKRVLHFAGEKKARYNLVTSNNLYFAGGILLGQKPFSKMQYILDRNIELPEDIKAVWQSDCDDYNAYNAFLANPAFFDEIKEINRTVAHHTIAIKQNKKNLIDTDYLVNKFTEGALAVADWLKAKASRADWRNAINDSEEILADAKEKLDAVILRYRGADKTPKSIFEACCARDNEIFETVKACFSGEAEVQA